MLRRHYEKSTVINSYLMLPQIFVFLFIAFIPSLIGAVSGIGGGIIIKPVLDAAAPFLGVPGPAEINFLSGCTVLTMSAVSLLRSFAVRNKGGGVVLERRRGTALAVGAALGGVCGKLVFAWAVSVSLRTSGVVVGRSIVSAIQSSILLVLTLAVLLYTLKKEQVTSKKLQNLPLCVLLGLFLGMLSAFLGIGGGPINIMVISYFFSMDTKITALHSIYTVFLSQLASLILTVVGGTIPPVGIPALLAMITGGAGGGLIGSHLAGRFSNRQVDWLFTLVLIIVLLLCMGNLAQLA
jgi:uncharacterized membrane protein YfcA